MGMNQRDIQQEILLAENEIKAKEEELETSRLRLKAAQDEQRRLAAVHTKAAALQSDLDDAGFGKLCRKVTVKDILDLFHDEIKTTIMEYSVVQATLADAISMIQACSESADAGHD